MSYRGDSEPEYIDDDEFFDGGAGPRGSNVLGGSGSWREDEAHDYPPEDRAPAAGRPAGTKPASGRREIATGKDRRSKARARNPAPAVASSAERRARLAGKKPGATAPGKQRPPEAEEARQQRRQPQPESRLGGLRARFSPAEDKAESKPAGDASRLASFTTGIGGRLGSWRGRIAGARAQAESAGDGTEKDAADFAQSERREKPAANISAGAAFPGRQSRAPQNANREPAASRAPKIDSTGWLDLDRKLDLLGVALVFGAIVFFLSALSAEQAAISGVNRLIGQALGWGAFAAPVSMFAIGFWLIVRHFGEEAPTIDPVRLGGIGLAFLSALVLFQYIESFAYPGLMSQFDICRQPSHPACVDALVQQSYQAGRGGGLIGGWIYSALVNSLTELGGFVIMLMSLTFSALMITRSSMAELTIVAIGLGRSLRTNLSHYAAKQRAARLEAQRLQALAGKPAHVRVSKPQVAQLSGAAQGAHALPEPRQATMPVPQRLRAFFGWRGKLSAVARGEPLPLRPATTASTAAAEASPRAGLRGRFFSRSRAPEVESTAPPRQDEPKAGALERFLNLGDDIPFAKEAAPVWRKPPRPQPAAAKPGFLPPERAKPPPEARAETSSTPAPKAAAAKSPSKNAPAEAPPAAATVARSLASSKPRIDWQLPDGRELLNSGADSELDREPLLRQAQVIEETLASFGAPGRIVEINSGPVITQYGVEPAYLTAKTGKQNRVKVGAIAKLDKDLQLALGARSIRVEAPVPGKGYVGIEVPNPAAARVSLRDVMESSSYQKIDSPLAIALGVSVDGTPICADLTQMPHLLIAGATGSGKSVCVNAIINSIIARNTPAAVKFIMVDPKRVELTGYNGLPHLVAPVVVELERTIGVLRWVTTEMDARYKKFSQAGARNIVDYNSILDPAGAPMPYIVVIIDELADLMMMAPDDTERAITRIAALARATGIHLVIATQRPSVDVVTGLIKANCPARIAFAVAGSVDSRVILDQPGAERLLGKGDMLYLSGNSPAPLRMQGVHVSNEEIDRIIRYWKLQAAGIEGIAGIEPIPLPALPTAQATSDASSGGEAPGKQASAQAAFWDAAAGKGNSTAGASESLNAEEDELYQTAVDMVRRLDKASISLLQRRLRIGYTRAARLMDMMEERKVVGPPKEGSSKPRDVLPV